MSAEVEPIPDLSHIPAGRVTWRRSEQERLAQEHAEATATPTSVAYIAEGWDEVHEVTRTREEVQALAEQLYGPAEETLVHDSRVTTPRVLR